MEMQTMYESDGVEEDTSQDCEDVIQWTPRKEVVTQKEMACKENPHAIARKSRVSILRPLHSDRIPAQSVSERSPCAVRVCRESRLTR